MTGSGTPKSGKRPKPKSNLDSAFGIAIGLAIAGKRKRVERCHDAGCGMAGDGFMDVKICFFMSNYVKM